ncbi:MAG: hypothetical protein M5U14_05175 [Acidimicrobiia bacterium]|nr:hypothetical protein [Acidimicrobiia bacterium]
MKRPAIDDTAASSIVDDDRTTSGTAPPLEIASQATLIACSTSGSSTPRAVAPVVTTKPGKVGNPASAHRARLAAFAPASAGSAASGESRLTTRPGDVGPRRATLSPATPPALSRMASR